MKSASGLPEFDTLVIGGGQAGITAAICAAEDGASVCLLEAAPAYLRGGNSRHTRNLRAMHNEPSGILSDRYPEEEYFDDLMQVTAGETNETLARLTIRQSADTIDWLAQRGVKFQPPLSGTLHLGRTNAFFLGGGKALLNALYRRAEALGITIHYETRVTELCIDDGVFKHAGFECHGGIDQIRARTLIAAAGGFQANLDWLQEAWGSAAKNFLIRGTPYNQGRILRLLLDNHVLPSGKADQAHCVAIDGRSPQYDGGIVTRIDCVPFGIVVNQSAERFADEGEDFWPRRYATWGQLVARQPDQIAWSIIDEKSRGLFIPPVFPPEQARSIAELATKTGLDTNELTNVIETFNRSVKDGQFDPEHLDNCHTRGLAIEKSHWARPIDTPPFYAYPLRPGITFTYLSVGINEQARILMSDGTPSTNMFATGEIMAGNILGQGYLAGIGITIGNVFGRLAGKEAARHVAS